MGIRHGDRERLIGLVGAIDGVSGANVCAYGIGADGMLVKWRGWLPEGAVADAFMTCGSTAGGGERPGSVTYERRTMMLNRDALSGCLGIGTWVVVIGVVATITPDLAAAIEGAVGEGFGAMPLPASMRATGGIALPERDGMADVWAAGTAATYACTALRSVFALAYKRRIGGARRIDRGDEIPGRGMSEDVVSRVMGDAPSWLIDRAYVMPGHLSGLRSPYSPVVSAPWCRLPSPESLPERLRCGGDYTDMLRLQCVSDVCTRLAGMPWDGDLAALMHDSLAAAGEGVPLDDVYAAS